MLTLHEGFFFSSFYLYNVVIIIVIVDNANISLDLFKTKGFSKVVYM